MSKDKHFLVNGEPYDMHELIELARQYDMPSWNGMWLTSEAAKTLRKEGYTVTDTRVGEPTP